VRKHWMKEVIVEAGSVHISNVGRKESKLTHTGGFWVTGRRAGVAGPSERGFYGEQIRHENARKEHK
jgi:hypothetical protein